MNTSANLFPNQLKNPSQPPPFLMPSKLCGSRKYPYPHHGGIGNSGGFGGRGVKDPGNSRGEGVGQSIEFPDVLNSIPIQVSI